MISLPAQYRCVALLAAWMLACFLAGSLHGGEVSRMRFLWAGTPAAEVISLYSGDDTAEFVTVLSPWRMSDAFPHEPGTSWAVAVGDRSPQTLHSEAIVAPAPAREALVLVWQRGNTVESRMVAMATGLLRRQVIFLNLTGRPLFCRIGDWHGCISPQAVEFSSVSEGESSAEVPLALAVESGGRIHPVFSTVLTVHPDDRMLIVAGPDSPNATSRRLPVRRICLRSDSGVAARTDARTSRWTGLPQKQP